MSVRYAAMLTQQRQVMNPDKSVLVSDRFHSWILDDRLAAYESIGTGVATLVPSGLQCLDGQAKYFVRDQSNQIKRARATVATSTGQSGLLLKLDDEKEILLVVRHEPKSPVPQVYLIAMRGVELLAFVPTALEPGAMDCEVELDDQRGIRFLVNGLTMFRYQYPYPFRAIRAGFLLSGYASIGEFRVETCTQD